MGAPPRRRKRAAWPISTRPSSRSRSTGASRCSLPLRRCPRCAGADVVVNPLDFAGLLLATTHGGQHIADYLADLASRQGKVRLIEREVRPEEIGTSLKDLTDGLGVRIIRDGQPYGFWRPQVAQLKQGDIVMAITPSVS